MKRTSFLALLALAASLLLTGCGGGGGTPTPTLPPGVDLVDDPARAIYDQPGWTIQRTVRQQPPKKWTVLVYVNGANDLETYGILNMNQMEEVGSTADVNIVVQFKRIAGRYDSSNGDWSDTRRFYVKRDSAPNTINSQLVSQRNNVDMGTVQTCQEFIQWGVRSFPADRYCLVVWNHGAGWRSKKTRAAELPAFGRGLSYDDVTKSHIDTIQIPAAIAHPDGHKWDTLAIDCSLMQMAEVAYEARNSALYITGSEESPPGEGYPYDAILSRLATNPTFTGRDLATVIVEETQKRYASSFQTPQGPIQPAKGITQSALDTSKLAAIIPALNALGSRLTTIQATYSTEIKDARADSQSYDYFENKDLIDYLNLLDQKIPDTQLRNATAAVRQAVQDAVIRNLTTSGYPAISNNGLALYIPSPTRYRDIDIEQANGFGQRYTALSLAKDAPNWQAFLASGP